jgi:hypothetical protein
MIFWFSIGGFNPTALTLPMNAMLVTVANFITCKKFIFEQNDFLDHIAAT